MTANRRLVVVGGGVIGTMHALMGVRRGYEVIHLERDLMPRGASVRNFGLVWVSGRSSGKELALALRARELWEDIANKNAKLDFRPAGSLTVARREEELEVLDDAVNLADAKERGFVLLDPKAARNRNPAVVGPFLGALFCDRDAIVEPRLALASLRDELFASGNYSWLPGRHVMDLKDQGVVDQTGACYDGDLVVCCIGARPGGLFEQALADAPLRRVRLQMLETRATDAEVATAIADGDSLRYYPAFAKSASSHLPAQEPLAASWAAQLLLVKRLNGCLTIGDTHRYEEPFDFDVDDTPYDHLLSVARGLLGSLPPVERRWSGVYSQVTDENLMYLRREVAPGVLVVTGPGGRGMTMSPAIAEETFL